MNVYIRRTETSRIAQFLLTLFFSNCLWRVQALVKGSRSCLDDRISRGDSLTEAVGVCELLDEERVTIERGVNWRDHVHYRISSEEVGSVIRRAEDDDRAREKKMMEKISERSGQGTENSASASGSWRPTRHRFGVEVVADEHIIMGNETAIYLRNRCKLHRYVIKSSGAQSLSIYWEKFTMPPTGVFMIYSDSLPKRHLHKFNSQSFMNKQNKVAVAHLPGEVAYIEYMETDCIQEDSTTGDESCRTADVPSIQVVSVVHGYKPTLFKTGSLDKDGTEGGSQLACSQQIDINCPIGDDWQDEKHSVVGIISDKTFTCTGALLRAPEHSHFSQLLLTAYHCIDPDRTATTFLKEWQKRVDDIETFWNFRFNYENEACGGNETNSINDGFVGPGSKVLTRFVATDYILLDITEPIPESFNPYFAGWDAREGEPLPSSAVVIHHPSGDAKKISISSGPFDLTNFNTKVPGASNSHWRVKYDIGATEPGSSGAPLFDANTRRIIGQLHGGDGSFCAAGNATGLGGDDSYGATFASWKAGMQLILGLHPGSPAFMDGSYESKQANATTLHFNQFQSGPLDVITVEEGMEDSNVSIKLAYPPSSPVVLLPTISFSNDSKCSPGGLGSCVVPCPSQLFFDGNNWDEAQNLTLHAVNDQRRDGYQYPSLNLFLADQHPDSTEPNLDLQGIGNLVLSDDDCPTKWQIIFPKSGTFPEENSWILRREEDIIAFGIGYQDIIPGGKGSLCHGGNFTITFLDNGRDGIGKDGGGFMKLKVNDTESILLNPSDVSFYYWRFFSFEVDIESFFDVDSDQSTIKGDCNSDGKVGNDDILQILSWIADDSQICSEHRCDIPVNADVNEDSYVSAVDTAELVLS